MVAPRALLALAVCACYPASYLTNKYVLSVLKFTYPTLFQGWQVLVGGLLLHLSWRRGWVEMHGGSRSDVLTWLPASMLFVGIIYAGSRALSRLPVPVFLILHNAAEVIFCGHQKCFRKEKISSAKICSTLFLLAAVGCLPFNDPQFDPEGYFWAVIHLLCVGAYKIVRKAQNPSALSDIDQQYLNYIFSVALLAFASHPTGDLVSVLDFPFLYFYRFHGSCCASGVLGFLLMLSTVKLQSVVAPGQCAAWIFLSQLPAGWARRGLAGFLRAEGLLITVLKEGDSWVETAEPWPQAPCWPVRKTTRWRTEPWPCPEQAVCCKDAAASSGFGENFLGHLGRHRRMANLAFSLWDSGLCCVQFCRKRKCRISPGQLHAP
ncbi:PREDICTED: transmembrane protein 241 isoform X2 [Chinchilla lanigera]|uniref:transmembrane protein 241 isoform X2 n=1 Tax=Chinchilla lanigera TaxID=34839 RepID=UPI00038EF018|nr:PREDICTED: transmembrane protein 241 isoform X2 [Chinchilla lanigera]